MVIMNSQRNGQSQLQNIPKTNQASPTLEEVAIGFSLTLNAKIIEDFESKASTHFSTNETFFNSRHIVCFLNTDLKDIPSANQIFSFTFNLYHSANLSEECLMLTLMYILRVLKTSEIKIFYDNWQIILIAATLISLRICNAAHYCSLQFESFFTDLSADVIFELEGEFSHLMMSQYEVDLSFFEKCFEILRCAWEEESQKKWKLNLEKVKEIIKTSKMFDEMEEDCGSRIIKSERIYNLDLEKFGLDN